MERTLDFSIIGIKIVIIDVQPGVMIGTSHDGMKETPYLAVGSACLAAWKAIVTND